MVSETTVMVANVLQSCIPILSLAAYIPQWRKLISGRSSKDISLRAWLMWSVSSGIAVFYAMVQRLLTGHGTALVFSSVANFLFVLITVGLVVRYRDKNLAGVGKAQGGGLA